MITKQLDNCNNEDEKARLLKQLDSFETNLSAQLAQSQDIQQRKLKEAIEARKLKRKGLMDKVSKEK
jgi:hypothetical protein